MGFGNGGLKKDGLDALRYTVKIKFESSGRVSGMTMSHTEARESGNKTKKNKNAKDIAGCDSQRFYMNMNSITK